MDAIQEGYHGVQAAVLGASGFIGRWVARALIERGAQVSLVVRDRNRAREIFTAYGVQGAIVAADLGSPSVVEALLADLQPAITFNLAGYGIDRSERDRATAYRINADLVAQLCAALAPRRDPNWGGQDLVHVGSALEYGESDGDLSEDSTPHPTTLYGQSKLAGTRNLAAGCERLGLRGLTARLFTVYGPGEHPGRLLPALLETARTGQPLALTAGTQQRDFTYVEDVAQGLLRLGLSKTRPGDVVNLATGTLTSVRDFASQAATLLGIPKESLHFGALPTREEEMQHAPVNIEKMAALTGWVPGTTISEGIRKTRMFWASEAPEERR